MRLVLNNIGAYAKLKTGLISGLVIGQMILAGYLLALDVSQSLFLAVLPGIPIALACCLALSLKHGSRYIEMSVVMLAAGGFGMLLGSVVDMHHAGSHGLLSHNHTAPLSLSWLGLEQLWSKLQLAPWMYLGMFVGGNLGMLLFDAIRRESTLALHNGLSMYAVCNVGMLFGMLLGENIAAALASYFNPLWAAVSMLGFMLLGMVVGMVALLALAIRVYRFGSLHIR